MKVAILRSAIISTLLVDSVCHIFQVHRIIWTTQICIQRDASLCRFLF